MRVSLDIVRGTKANDVRSAYASLLRHYVMHNEVAVQSEMVPCSTLFSRNDSLEIQKTMSNSLLGDCEAVRMYPLHNFGMVVLETSSNCNGVSAETQYNIRGVLIPARACFLHYTLHTDRETNANAWISHNILSVCDVGALKQNMHHNMSSLLQASLTETDDCVHNVNVKHCTDACNFQVMGNPLDVLGQTIPSSDGKMNMRIWATNDGLHMTIKRLDSKRIVSIHCKHACFHPQVQLVSSGTTLRGVRRLFSTMQRDSHSSMPMYRVGERHTECCMTTRTYDLAQAMQLIASMNLRAECGRPVGRNLERLGISKPVHTRQTLDTRGVSCFDNSMLSGLLSQRNTNAVALLQKSGFSRSAISTMLPAAIAVDIETHTAAIRPLVLLTSPGTMCRGEYVQRLMDTIVTHGAHDGSKLPVYYQAHFPLEKATAVDSLLKLAVVAHDIVCFFDNETEQLHSAYVGDIAHHALSTSMTNIAAPHREIVSAVQLKHTLDMVAPRAKFCLHSSALRLVVLNNLALRVEQLGPLHRTLRSLWFATEMHNVNAESAATYCAYVHALSALAKMPLQSNNFWAMLPHIAPLSMY